MQVWMLLITALVPLAMAPGLVSAFDITPKIAILLFSESVVLLFCKQLVKAAPDRLFTAILAVLWLSLGVSTVWSANPALSISGSSWRREGFVIETALLLFAWLAAGF